MLTIATFACWAALRRPAHPAAGAAHGHPRLRAVRCGAAADLCEQRFGCCEADALRVEQKLLAGPARTLSLTVAQERCDRLQARLGLSEAQLQKVVVALPQEIGRAHV